MAGAVLLEEDPPDYACVDGFVLLGNGEWTTARQRLLHAALVEQPRPVLVGNPDLVAPHETGLSREPGLFAHALADTGVAEPVFFGKPFGNAFELVARTLRGIDDGNGYEIIPRRLDLETGTATEGTFSLAGDGTFATTPSDDPDTLMVRFDPDEGDDAGVLLSWPRVGAEVDLDLESLLACDG